MSLMPLFFKIQYVLFLILFLGSCSTASQEKKTNALIKESSPYLLQHAYNPVDWQRWEDGLYHKQNSDKKLLLVSIGYSSCHWCHVMEEETFEDQEVATLMNTHFINIKVDREENPDVDNIYMTAVQLMTGSGGWPLNVICLPDGRPIYGGTYHTKEQWTKILNQVQAVYQKNPERLVDYATKLQQGIQQVNTIQLPKESPALDVKLLEREMAFWKQRWDTTYGGENNDQKFITPVKFNYLLHYTYLYPEEELSNHFTKSLITIANSGVFDHLEGGFFRYSVDRYWNIPHFEKMLYDNAQVMGLYANAYKVTKKTLFKKRVEQTYTFLMDKMEGEKGGFYAAIDADNPEGEGRYYLWTEEELTSAIGNEFSLFTSYYAIDLNKPFEEQFYLLRREASDTDFLRENKLSKKALAALKLGWKKKLTTLRKKKAFPRIDNKILTSWNAMTVVGLTKSYEAFNNPKFLEKAITIFDFISNKNLNNGNLYHTYQNGKPKIKGFLEDYAHMIKAALKLYENTLNTRYLEQALSLTESSLKKFNDSDSSFFTFKENQPLLSKIIAIDDGVLPSPNAVMAENLWTLSQLLGRNDFQEKAEKMLKAIQPFLTEGRSDYTFWTQLFGKVAGPHYEVVIVGPKAKALTSELNSHYLPNIVFQATETPSDLPLLKDRFYKGETYIYVCKNKVCLRPETTVKEALEQINNWK